MIDRIGAIVEQPKFFPSFSGRKNLTLLARGIGTPRQRVDAVLDEVGLADRARDKFRTYSLGMKQRLAIAATLLKDPGLLIFDEPTNGLDPAGIHEIRATMRDLADRGKTVLVSSHILSEVQQVADTVSIIGRGRMLAEGRVARHPRRRRRAARPGRRRRPGPGGRLLERGRVRGSSLRPSSFTSAPSNGTLDLAQITRVLADQGLYVDELVAGAPGPGVGLPGADRRRAPRAAQPRAPRVAPDGAP